MMNFNLAFWILITGSLGWPRTVFTGLNSSNYYASLLEIDTGSIDGSVESVESETTSAASSAGVSSGNSSVRKERVRPYTWFFSLAVRVRFPHQIAATFLNVLNSNYCKRIQVRKLHAEEDSSIISFSVNTDAASIFQVGQRSSCASYWIHQHKKQTWNNVVQEWLHHPDIINLEAHTWYGQDVLGGE